MSSSPQADRALISRSEDEASHMCICSCVCVCVFYQWETIRRNSNSSFAQTNWQLASWFYGLFTAWGIFLQFCFFLVGRGQLFFSSYLCISLSGYNIHQRQFRNSNEPVIKVLATWQQPKQALIRSQGESICRSCRTRFSLFFHFTHHLTCVWHPVPGWQMSPIFTALL